MYFGRELKVDSLLTIGIIKIDTTGIVCKHLTEKVFYVAFWLVYVFQPVIINMI